LGIWMEGARYKYKMMEGPVHTSRRGGSATSDPETGKRCSVVDCGSGASYGIE
jgi:hypothetical protein